jgi:hypothetical protein
MLAAPADRRATRAALACEARRLAEEMEGLYIQLEQIGALATIHQYILNHSEGSPRLDLLQTAKTLRCYAGVLSLLASRHAASQNHQ